MIFKDYYKILGLETNRVSIDEIKVAYRAKAKKYHPDLNVGNKLAEERIKDINEAYKTLSIPASKRKYDRKWTAYVGSKSSIFEKNGKSKDILKNMFFGSMEENKKEKSTGKAKNGENIETFISSNIYEAFYGVEKKISLKTVQGKIKNLSVTIPEGIKDGEKIRLMGQGKPGENGGKPGDLYIKINIKNDKNFKLKGHDLYTNLYITPWEAALGKRVDVKSIDEETKVYIPKGVQSGEIIKIPGKGYKKGQGERGDLIAEIKIMIPKKMNEKEQELFKQLDEISNFNPRV